MKEQAVNKNIVTLRTIFQWVFFSWVIFIGIRFGMFVRHFETSGASAFVSPPPSVDGFLPIGALASLKQWIVKGELNPLHPASVVVFLTIVGMSFLAKKSFCAWLFPVVALMLFAAGIGAGVVTGSWQSSLGYDDYRQLIPLAPFLGH